MSLLDELKKEADDLGVSYHKTIGAEKLQEKIDAFYESQETSGTVVQQAVEEKEKQKKEEPKQDSAKGLTDKVRKRLEREKQARATRVVTIIDNDQRVNSQATTCTVNCSNEFFDLGTRIIPLNEKVEVSMGHIRTLQQVRIPLHMKDPKSGLATVRMRPRYTISFEDVK